MGNKVYVLTETDSTDYRWCYNQTFSSREKAIERMRELYHENVVEREDFVVCSEFNEKEGTAAADMGEGILLAWNVKECEIL